MISELQTQTVVDFGFQCGTFLLHNPTSKHTVYDYIDRYPQGSFYIAIDYDKAVYLFKSTPYTVDKEDFWDSDDGSICLGQAKIFWDESNEWMTSMVPISKQEFIKQMGLQ